MKHPLLRFCLVAIALAPLLLSNGCASGQTPEPPSALQQGESTWGHFVDRVDNGDDPWNGGCHYKCSDPDCSAALEFWGSDWCVASDLQEWTNSGPHGAESDIKRYDCDQECKEKGFEGGRCEQVENVCDGVRPSSRCACDEQ
jgi:hypothetical protein